MLFIPSFAWRICFLFGIQLYCWLGWPFWAFWLRCWLHMTIFYIHILRWKASFKIWPQVRSGQRQVTTGVGQYAYLPRRLDEPSRLAPFARLYLHLSWFIGKNRTSTSFDLRWPPRDPQSSVAYWSSQMGWVSMILKELGGFGWFMWNGKHFHISS